MAGNSGVSEHVRRMKLPIKNPFCKPEVRKSPRLAKKATKMHENAASKTRRLNFEDGNGIESEVLPSQASVNQASTYASTIEDAYVYNDDDEYQVNLTNVDEDECHPDDNPEPKYSTEDEDELREDEDELREDEDELREDEDELREDGDELREDGDKLREDGGERRTYVDFISDCVREDDNLGNDDEHGDEDWDAGGICDPNGIVNDEVRGPGIIREMHEEELADWEFNFGEHAVEPEDLSLADEVNLDAESGHICVNMEFEDLASFKEHLREYAIIKKFEWKYKKLNPKMAYLVCKNKESQDCLWQVSARQLPNESTVTVRSCNLAHKCIGLKGDRNSMCNSRFVANYLLKQMGATSIVPSPVAIKDDIIWPKYGCAIPYWLAAEARVC